MTDYEKVAEIAERLECDYTDTAEGNDNRCNDDAATLKEIAERWLRE